MEREVKGPGGQESTWRSIDSYRSSTEVDTRMRSDIGNRDTLKLPEAH